MAIGLLSIVIAAEAWKKSKEGEKMATIIFLLVLCGLLRRTAARISSAPPLLTRQRKRKRGADPRRRQIDNGANLRQLQAENRLREEKRRQREKIYAAEDKRRIEAEKRAAQAARAEAQGEKRRQQVQQAEADKAFFENQMTVYNDMLTAVDDAIQEARRQIDINTAMQSYDKNKRERAALEKLLKKQIGLENKIHTLENKLAKCYYIINQN